MWGVGGKHACFYTSEYIKTTRDKIKTNQMDLIIEMDLIMDLIHLDHNSSTGDYVESVAIVCQTGFLYFCYKTT